MEKSLKTYMPFRKIKQKKACYYLLKKLTPPTLRNGNQLHQLIQPILFELLNQKKYKQNI